MDEHSLGDYSFAGDIWIADDGQPLFARSGNVFRSSEVRAQDMLYNGQLAGATSIQWLDHSSAMNRIFCVLRDGFLGEAPPEIRVYDATFLAFRGTLGLPGFLVPNGQGGGTLHAAKGRFVFVNGAGTQLTALVQAQAGSGLLNDWAVTEFDVGALP